ncbi:hypothetical protein [Companilactobacillus kedongensis]|nr:hypothetical protein [Companilactobacillus kedongensis]
MLNVENYYGNKQQVTGQINVTKEVITKCQKGKDSKEWYYESEILVR